MTSEKFEELYKKLNPKQKEAVDSIDGPVMDGSKVQWSSVGKAL